MLYSIPCYSTVERIKRFKKFIPDFAITGEANNQRATNSHCVYKLTRDSKLPPTTFVFINVLLT